MKYHYDLLKGAKKFKTKFAIGLTTLGVLIGGSGLSLAILGSAGAATNTIYNNIPSPQPGNVTSQAFEAQSVSEFGGQVSYVGNAVNPTVTVLMSSWGCESGHWYSSDCVTTPGSTFSTPITLKIYAVSGSNAPGAVLATSTKTFNIPYRPSADNTKCNGNDAGKWFSATDNTCYNGFATPVSFNVSGTLPSKVIVSLAYNTTHYGYAHIGEATSCFVSSGGCGYDSLNVGLSGSPSVGTAPLPDDAYINSTSGGAYCSGSTGSFRLDTGCWTGFQPAIKIDVTTSGKALGSVTGGLTLKNPHQQISFNAFDFGANSASDYGTVEYQNFDYPGGLHYNANVICATVGGNNARFVFQIPAGFPGLSGLYVGAAVVDGGSPGTKDTYGHGATSDLTTALGWCETGAGMGVSNYTITGGNAVVH